MVLIIDIGNTRTKTGIFSGSNLKKIVRPDIRSTSRFRDFLSKNKIERIFVGTVKNQIPSSVLKNGIAPVELFSHKTRVPIKNKYKTAFTLGSDRLAAAVGGWKMFPGFPVLVIDAGTCLKFNFVSVKGEYLGGSIAPGLEMRYKALHNFTDRLPLINSKTTKTPLLGNSTELSIRSGVENGMIAETKGLIGDYLEKYPKLKIVVTGGDGEFFVRHLKMPIFADPNLVLKGLNEILLFNAA
jgi:type III pantothenate kinase